MYIAVGKVEVAHGRSLIGVCFQERFPTDASLLLMAKPADQLLFSVEVSIRRHAEAREHVRPIE